jgi:hypothetical protein
VKEKPRKTAEPKTKPTAASVAGFLASIPDPGVRRDCRTVAALMRKVTGVAPVLWGSSIVGFGQYHYVYASGREGDWPLTAFSPRKRSLTVYLMNGFDSYGPRLKRLGPHTLGKSCLYLDGLAGIDLGVLEAMLRDSVARMRKAYRS